MPKLTIITVNLNNAQGLYKTLESVSKQVFPDFEYIIIDGGSTDGSVDIIKEFSARITYWVSEPDKGIYNAMNKGIQKAAGEYCFFLNSGDYLYSKETIEQVFQVSDEYDIIYGDVFVKRQLPEKNWVRRHPIDISFMNFYISGICHQGAFIKRRLFDEYGLYNESFKIVSDWEFFLKTIVFSNASNKHIDLIISVYNSEGLSAQNTRLLNAERQHVLEEKFPKLVLKDYEFFKDNYSDLQGLINIKKHKLSYFIFKGLKRATRLLLSRFA